MIPSRYLYSRLSHFDEKLAELQGKECINIPETEIEKITYDLCSQSDDPWTPKEVRKSLSRLSLRKYYENVNHISQKLGWKNPIQLTPEEEDI